MTTPLITASGNNCVCERESVIGNCKIIGYEEAGRRRPVRQLHHGLGLEMLNLQTVVRRRSDVADETMAVYPSKHMRHWLSACADQPRVLAEISPVRQYPTTCGLDSGDRADRMSTLLRRGDHVDPTPAARMFAKAAGSPA